MPRMTEPGDAEADAKVDAESAARRSNVGTLLLLVALVVVLLQAISAGTKDWPNLLAVVLAVTGAGLRIEGVLLRRGR
jgi:hypothetical protein